MFSQGREVFNGRGRFCLYAVSGIINKVNQQYQYNSKIKTCAAYYGNIIRRLISVAPLKSGSAKGKIFHWAS